MLRLSFLAVIFAFACVLHSPAALAEGQELVVILTPPPPRSAETEETFTRLEAELRASGFDVRVETLSSDEPRQALEDAVNRNDAAAAITIRQDPASSGKPEVWVRDRLTGKLVVRQDDGPAGSPRLIAIHAVELLRASLIELRDPPPSKKPDGPTPLPDPVKNLIGPDPPPPPASSAWAGFSVELGVGALFHFDPPIAMAAPELRLSYGSSIGLGARLSLVGPSLGPDLRARASLSEVFATAEFVYAPPLPWPFELAVAGGVGVYRVGAESALSDAVPSRGGEYVATIVTATVTSGVRLTDHFSVDANLFTGIAAPKIVILNGEEELGALGQPLLGITAGLRARF